MTRIGMQIALTSGIGKRTYSVTQRMKGNKMDRSAINKALAKAMAYKACGNREAEARQWARELARLLEVADILK